MLGPVIVDRCHGTHGARCGSACGSSSTPATTGVPWRRTICASTNAVSASTARMSGSVRPIPPPRPGRWVWVTPATPPRPGEPAPSVPPEPDDPLEPPDPVVPPERDDPPAPLEPPAPREPDDLPALPEPDVSPAKVVPPAVPVVVEGNVSGSATLEG